MWRALIVALLALAAALAAPGAAAAAEALVTASGVVADGENNDGRIWFQLQRDDKRFVADPAQLPDRDAFWDALRASNDTGRSIVVRYDGDAGFIDFATSAPTFVARELSYEGRTVAGAPPPSSRPAEGHGPRRAAESAVAKAVALFGHGDLDGAREAAERALAGGALEPRLQALALKTRADVASTAAYARIRQPGPERDRLLMSALADYDAWRTLAPDDGAAALAVGGSLRDLGAYEEALGVYDFIRRNYAKQAFWGHVRTAATYRTLGQHDKALAAMEELVKALGPQDGMAFHYHRGWTLTEAGRLDEAVAAFTAGIRTQPDFAWAFLKRACALARLGRLDEAVADQTRGVELMKANQADGVISPNRTHDLEWASQGLERLRAARASAPKARLDVSCDGAWDYGERRRERSALLPADWARRHPSPVETPPAPAPLPEPVRTETAA